jgi:predicted nucleic acid-binding protein
VYLWDSNILRAHGENHPTLSAHLRLVPWPDIALPSDVVAEAMRGRGEYALKAPPERAAFAHRQLLETFSLLQTFHILTLDQASAVTLAELLRRHQSRKRYADMMIAALALAGRHVLVTRNQKHFADLLPPAQLQNWLDDPPR